MLFFRVILCVVGLLLYLVIRELSDAPVIDPISPPATAAFSDAVPMMPPWDAASAGAYQPVAAKPAERRTHLP